MEVFLAIVLFIVGLALIIKGGDFFVDGASWFAEKSGIPKLIVGATIVSVATTLPEMVTSFSGTAQGSLGLAMGNAVGSVIANTAMIMSISIIFMPVIVKRKDYLFKSILFIGVSALLLVFLLNGNMDVFESIIILLFAIVFMVENYLVAKETVKATKVINKANKKAFKEAREAEKLDKCIINNTAQQDKKKENGKILTINILKFLFGAAGIFFGAQLLVKYGKELALLMGISEAIVGLTIVAIGTSLPELVTTITAIRKKQSSLSIGNIIGANIIDISLILPICGFISGGVLRPDTMQTAYLDLPMVLIIAIIMLVPTLIKKKFSRWQGILSLIMYIAYLVIIAGNFIQF